RVRRRAVLAVAVLRIAAVLDAVRPDLDRYGRRGGRPDSDGPRLRCNRLVRSASDSFRDPDAERGPVDVDAASASARSNRAAGGSLTQMSFADASRRASRHSGSRVDLTLPLASAEAARSAHSFRAWIKTGSTRTHPRSRTPGRAFAPGRLRTEPSGRERYCLMTGAIRRTSSKKFISSVTWRCTSVASVPPGGMSTAKRFPSGARSRLGVKPVFASRLSDHRRGLSATKVSPFAV